MTEATLKHRQGAGRSGVGAKTDDEELSGEEVNISEVTEDTHTHTFICVFERPIIGEVSGMTAYFMDFIKD